MTPATAGTRRYTRDHAWVVVSGTRARVGISDFAQAELGEIAYVELPRVGRALRRGDAGCTVDSLKTSSEIYAPVSGTVVEVNSILATDENCGLINRDPLGQGWLFAVEMTDPAELDSLLSEQAYLSFIDGD